MLTSRVSVQHLPSHALDLGDVSRMFLGALLQAVLVLVRLLLVIRTWSWRMALAQCSTKQRHVNINVSLECANVGEESMPNFDISRHLNKSHTHTFLSFSIYLWGDIHPSGKSSTVVLVHSQGAADAHGTAFSWVVRKKGANGQNLSCALCMFAILKLWVNKLSALKWPLWRRGWESFLMGDCPYPNQSSFLTCLEKKSGIIAPMYS